MSRVLSPFATIGTKKDKIVVVWLYLLVNVRSFDSIVCFLGGADLVSRIGRNLITATQYIVAVVRMNCSRSGTGKLTQI